MERDNKFEAKPPRWGQGSSLDPGPNHHHRMGPCNERGRTQCTDPFCLYQVTTDSPTYDLVWQIDVLRIALGAALTLVVMDEQNLTLDDPAPRHRLVDSAMEFLAMTGTPAWVGEDRVEALRIAEQALTGDASVRGTD